MLFSKPSVLCKVTDTSENFIGCLGLLPPRLHSGSSFRYNFFRLELPLPVIV